MEIIKKTLACLDTSKTLGLDGIFSKSLKDSPKVIALPLCNLLNLLTL